MFLGVDPPPLVRVFILRRELSLVVPASAAAASNAGLMDLVFYLEKKWWGCRGGVAKPSSWALRMVCSAPLNVLLLAPPFLHWFHITAFIILCFFSPSPFSFGGSFYAVSFCVWGVLLISGE